MKKEYWKPVVGYEGHYQVSNWGRVKSIKFGKGRILKPGTNKDGYLQVDLCKNNKSKTFRVNRLVAEAFLEIPEELRHLEGTRYLQVNHKDENKQNNVVTNLEWCDVKYNNEYNNGQKRRAIKRLKPIIQYTLDGELVREWESAKQAEKEGGFSSAHICDVLKGKRKTHKGFKWSYKNK